MMRLSLVSSLVALLALSAPAAPPNLDYFKGCGLRGTATSECAKKLNRLKNRYRSPSPSDINSDIDMDAILDPGDDRTRWRSSDAVKVTAYIASVEPGGFKESCNCKKASLRDIHINLVSDPADIGNAERYVVAEITPRMQYLNESWTNEYIESLEGKRVQITGWLLFDGMHSAESFNTKDYDQRCGSLEVNEIWRATAWEIHPVTAFKVLDE